MKTKPLSDFFKGDNYRIGIDTDELYRVDFSTFCYSGDAHRLHKDGQLNKQVSSNDYSFDNIFVVYQNCNPNDYNSFNIKTDNLIIEDIDTVLQNFGVDLTIPQYTSDTDNHHGWKKHVVNHVRAIQESKADYMVFADNDCWMVNQGVVSWVVAAIRILQTNPDVFIVSPNDGEPQRKTQVFSQQMFLVGVNDFKNMDFNQPEWDGNVRNHSELPEYHAMGEGRMHHYCKHIGKYRYVLGSEHRYFHHNVIKEDGMFDTDYKKLGWV